MIPIHFSRKDSIVPHNDSDNTKSFQNIPKGDPAIFLFFHQYDLQSKKLYIGRCTEKQFASQPALYTM